MDERQPVDLKSFQAREWPLAHGRSIGIGPRSLIMGILNVTPDSFSDGGLFLDPQAALDQASRMVAEGAHIIDVGGESTRPGANPIDAETEQRRILSIIGALAARGMIVSVDTWRAETAKLAIEAGAHIINDIWGLQKDAALAGVAAQHDAGVVVMHNSRERQCAPDPLDDQFRFLQPSLKIAADAGIDPRAILVDPGFGFGKDGEENLILLARLEELHKLGRPLVVGASRKRFIGTATGRQPADRAVGTAATNVVARMKGAVVFRVHDVAENHDALAMADAILAKNLQIGAD